MAEIPVLVAENRPASSSAVENPGRTAKLAVCWSRSQPQEKSGSATLFLRQSSGGERLRPGLQNPTAVAADC